MAKLKPEESRQLAEAFYRLSKELGDYRFSHWNEMKPAQRLAVESLEWSLLNASSDFTAGAVGVALDEVSSVLARVSRATKSMNAAIKRAKRVDKVLGIAEAAVRLAAALVTGSPSAIAAALERALKKAS